MKIIEKEYNVTTGEETLIERDETATEIAEREAREVKKIAQETELAAKSLERQAILDRLGLTQEEAALFLGAN